MSQFDGMTLVLSNLSMLAYSVQIPMLESNKNSFLNYQLCITISGCHQLGAEMLHTADNVINVIKSF